MNRRAGRTLSSLVLAWFILIVLALPSVPPSVSAASEQNNNLEAPPPADPESPAPTSSDAEPASVQHTAYIAGYADGTFKPDRELSRAELAAFLSRAVKRAEEEDTETPAFSDVDADDWASDAIARTVRMHLMAGLPDGTFAPERPATFGELTIVFGRLLGSETEAVSIMSEDSGDSATELHAGDSVTRAEFVVWMNRILRRGPLSGAPQQWTDVSASRADYGDIQEASISHVYNPTPDESEQWGVSAW